MSNTLLAVNFRDASTTIYLKCKNIFCLMQHSSEQESVRANTMIPVRGMWQHFFPTSLAFLTEECFNETTVFGVFGGAKETVYETERS